MGKRLVLKSLFGATVLHKAAPTFAASLAAAKPVFGSNSGGGGSSSSSSSSSGGSSGGGGAGSGGAGSGGGGTGGGGIAVNPLLVQNTSSLVVLAQTINNLIADFVQGSASSVDATTAALTADYYNSLALQLAGLQMNSGAYPDYEVVRYLASNALQNLQLSIQNTVQLQNGQTELADLQALVSNSQQLIEYLASFAQNQNSAALFPDTAVQTILAEIQPGVLQYIRTYGVPSNGVFDPIKLGAFLAATNP